MQTMPLAELIEQLNELVANADQAFQQAADQEGLEAARIEYLGAKSGKLKDAQKQMAGTDKSDRPLTVFFIKPPALPMRVQ